MEWRIGPVVFLLTASAATSTTSSSGASPGGRATKRITGPPAASSTAPASVRHGQLLRPFEQSNAGPVRKSTSDVSLCCLAAPSDQPVADAVDVGDPTLAVAAQLAAQAAGVAIERAGTAGRRVSPQVRQE